MLCPCDLNNRVFTLLVSLALLFSWIEVGQCRSADVLDTIALGSNESEKAHSMTVVSSDIVKGLLDEPARRLLVIDPKEWNGGKLSFRMKVDSEKQNYLSARLSGAEINPNYLLLFCEGKQVGYRHLGDIDVLALPDEAPRYNGRFYYVTTPLPLGLTRGKSEISLEIRTTGPIWGYGNSFEKYQKPMTVPSPGDI